MSFSLLAKKALSVVLLPPLLPLLCCAAGLLLMRSKPRIGRSLAWGGLLLALGLSTPATVALLVRPLEQIPVLHSESLAKAEAIVILAGGARRFQPEYGGPGPNRLSHERLRYGARLARESGLPLLLSGGAPPERVAEAELMATVLREDFGLTPRWVETASLDTADNASYSAAILREAGIRRIVLVTHAIHMRRSLGEFKGQGLEIHPAPTGFLHDETDAHGVFYYLPGATAAYNGWYASHEWVGLLAQRLKGWRG
jgi:uncharacterized SAM-binding protein YcdF (DUF218 family)